MNFHHNQVVIILIVFAALITTAMSGGFGAIPRLAIQVDHPLSSAYSDGDFSEGLLDPLVEIDSFDVVTFRLQEVFENAAQGIFAQPFIGEDADFDGLPSAPVIPPPAVVENCSCINGPFADLGPVGSQCTITTPGGFGAAGVTVSKNECYAVELFLAGPLMGFRNIKLGIERKNVPPACPDRFYFGFEQNVKGDWQQFSNEVKDESTSSTTGSPDEPADNLQIKTSVSVNKNDVSVQKTYTTTDGSTGEESSKSSEGKLINYSGGEDGDNTTKFSIPVPGQNPINLTAKCTPPKN